MVEASEIWIRAQSMLSEFWARVDRIDTAPAASLFTADGEMLLGIVEARGADKLAEYFSERNKRELEQGRYTRHALVNLWLKSVDSGCYDFQSLVLVHAGVGTLPIASAPPSSVADFHYRLIASPNGLRIKRMSSTLIFVGPSALAAQAGQTTNS